jgi:hypothetical protein
MTLEEAEAFIYAHTRLVKALDRDIVRVLAEVIVEATKNVRSVDNATK